MSWRNFLALIASFALKVSSQETNGTEATQDSISIGPCVWKTSAKCPDKDVQFYIFTQSNPDDRQAIHIDETWETSNLSSSFYDPMFPAKVIIHGYNSDMQLTPLIDMKQEYLRRGKYNLFFVDWSVIGPAPCYLAAAHNTRHVGSCVAQLVDRIRESGNHDIHLIGFSLGAHVTNYASTALRPNFTLPRITGLDPAMPLFVTANIDNKLDASDAEFVDVFHTNAFVQGKIEQCGHVDFYFNGGISQPGCPFNHIFQCSHHRAPNYFAESIQSTVGFWGWKCQSYMYYLLGLCTPSADQQIIAGEDCKATATGIYFLNTNPESPFAHGRVEAAAAAATRSGFYFPQGRSVDPLIREIDEFGKLEGNFNNLPYPQLDNRFASFSKYSNTRNRLKGIW